MKDSCSFCDKTSDKANVVPLKGLVFIDDAEVIKISTILSDVLPKYILNLNWICEDCYIIIVKFYQLKCNIVKTSLAEGDKLKVEGPVPNSSDVYAMSTNSNGVDAELFINEMPEIKTEAVEFDESGLLVEIKHQRDNETYSDTDDELDTPKRVLRTSTSPPVKDEVVKTEDVKPQKFKSKRTLKYLKGKTPKLMKPSKTSQVFDLMEEGKLCASDRKFVNENIEASRLGRHLYRCEECSQTLHSHTSVFYHFISKHLLPSDPRKTWVAAKLRAGRRTSIIEGEEKVSWKCSACPREFQSHPAIRYHLHRHLIEGDVNIDSN